MNRTHRPRPGRALVAGALGAALLVGCSSAADDSSSAPTEPGVGGDAVTISFNWWGGDARAELQQQVIAAFEEEYPDITVSPEYSNYDDFWTKLNTRAAAQDLPDVMTTIDPFMYDYIKNGFYLDLSQHSEVIDLTSIPENLFSMVTQDGAIYGTPSGVATFGVAVDVQAFEEAGVPLPDDTSWSWDDMIATAAAVSEASPGVAGMILPMDQQLASIWLRQNGEDWGPVDGSAEGLGFTAETLGGYWEWVRELQESGGTQNADAAVEAQAAGAGLEQSDLALGKAAMGVISVNQLAVLEEASGREFALLHWPGESQAEQLGAWAKPGTFYSVNAATEHPEEAALFVEFITNSPVAGEIMMFDRGMHPNPDVVASLQESMSESDQRFADFVGELTSRDLQPFYPQNVGAGNISGSEFSTINQDVIFGASSPEEAAQTYFDQLSAAVS